MKTRKDLQRETAEIIRIMSSYRTLKYNQILRIFSKKPEIIRNIISRLIRDKRLFYNEENEMLSYGCSADENPNNALISAFWVLVDFFGGVEYHTPSEYPAQIAFFMNGEFYEIIYAEYGKEIIINHSLSSKNREQSKEIIVVEDETQISKIKADDIFCFCIVGTDCGIDYYNFE